ncbi:MAG: T9SS type A sorting domain-containing protein [Bacteroidales bacterium]|jgi:hypothetical protein|nr:T9SS type A sorting domain-containing protein [Bacteroidales bacterium]
MIKFTNSIIILTASSLLSVSSYAQKMAVAPGTTVMAAGGLLAVKPGVTNNGTFVNQGNSFVFTGTGQVLNGSSGITFDNVVVSDGTSVTFSGGNNTLSGALLVDGTLNPGGRLTLLSDSARTAMIDGAGKGQVSGSLTMQKFIPSSFGYHYLSSPFQSSTVAQLGDEVNLSASFPPVYRYDENRAYSGWVNHSNPANLLEPMRGYSVLMGLGHEPVTADLEGVPGNGKISLALLNNNQPYTKGFNLAGNPYPSPIDWDSPSGWTKTNIDDAIFYFLPGTVSQYSGTYSSYQNGISSDGEVSGIIPAMQGFFVHVTDGSYPVSALLEVNNDARVTTTAKSSKEPESKGTTALVRLAAGYSDNLASYDPFVIYYNEKSTNGFDGQYDALKLFNTDASVTNFYVFAEDGTKLSINALPSAFDTLCTVRLGLKTERSGELVFRIKDVTGFYADKTIQIRDVVTGASVILRTDNDFRVSLPAGDYQNRFFLNMFTFTTDIADDVTEDGIWFRAYESYGSLMAEIRVPEGRNGLLTVTNLNGQILFSAKVHGTGQNEFHPALSEGIYIVTLSSGTLRKSQKIYFGK